MKYVPPVGQPADTPYENFDPANGVDGSVVPAESIEHPMREIIAAIIALGQTPDGNKLNQLAQGLAGKLAAGGHKHNIADVNTLQSILDSLQGGLSGVSSRKINTAAPLSGGGDLSADRTFKLNTGKGLKIDANLLTLAIAAGSALVFKGNELDIDFSQMPTDKFEAMLKSIRVPLWLSKNTTWYVDGTNGSDQNDGSSPTKAFKTIQAAVNYVSENFNFGRYTATVSVAGGVYSELISLPKYNASTGYFQITGSSDTANPTALVGCVYCSASGLGTYTLNNLPIEFNGAVTPGSVHYRSISGSPGTTINIYNCAMNLGTTPLSFTRVCVAPSGGVINILDGCSMTGLASHFFYLTGGSLALHRDMSINGDCGVDVFRARDLSVFSTNAPSNGGVNPVITGVVNSGRRYYVAGNSICSTGGGGAEYFPGATLGQVYTGGQYS